jgi:hypothetical protein
VLQVGGGKTVTLSNVRPPAKTLALSAEALVETMESIRGASSRMVRMVQTARMRSKPLHRNSSSPLFSGWKTAQ